MLFKYHRGLAVRQLTFSFSLHLIVKHKGELCGQCAPSAVGARSFFLICLLHVWVPLRFSGSVLSSVSLSSLLPRHAPFHLAQPPPLQSSCSYGFVDVLFGLILNCLSATMTSAESVYFCNLLNWGHKGMQTYFSKYFPDSLGCSWFCNGSFL